MSNYGFMSLYILSCDNNDRTTDSEIFFLGFLREGTIRCIIIYVPIAPFAWLVTQVA